jgi:hypothetical protein
VSKHWIASELSKHNRVLFVEPEVWVGGFLKSPRTMLPYLGRFLRPRRAVNPNLLLFTPRLWPQFLRRPPIADQIAAEVARLGFDRTVLLNFRMLHSVIGRVREAVSVYYCVDPADEGPEREICHKSDLIYAVSEAYKERLARYGSPAPIHVIPHGFPVQYARQVLGDAGCGRPKEFQRFKGPVVGFAGLIHDANVDIDLLETIAREREAYNFVLIGPHKANSLGRGMSAGGLRRLRNLRNVHLLGPRDFWDLPKYVKHFDACTVLIPTARDNAKLRLGQRTLFKWLLYLSQGKPVVAPQLDEATAISHLVYLATDSQDYLGKLDAALDEPPVASVRDERMAYAAQFSFERVLEKIVAPLAERIRVAGCRSAQQPV